jgi:transcriptional regulator with XRE-family HTH domain
MKRELLITLRGTKSQDKLAKELGISQQFLSAIELGVRNPNVKLMKKFEEYFKVPMEELFPDIFMNIRTTKCDIKKKEAG